jgi:hypothetical protein
MRGAQRWPFALSALACSARAQGDAELVGCPRRAFASPAVSAATALLAAKRGSPFWVEAYLPSTAMGAMRDTRRNHTMVEY